MENSKTLAQTLLGETAHLGFCPPQIGFFGGPGALSLDANVFLKGVTYLLGL